MGVTQVMERYVQPRLVFAGLAILISASAIGLAAQDNGAVVLSAQLTGRALLPALTFVSPPKDAPPGLRVSGRFAGPNGRRTEEVGGLVHTTGVKRPFKNQPVQGVSAVVALGPDRVIALSDNGFGAKWNSADVMLMLHEFRMDWQAGRMTRTATTFLRDPDRRLPFPIVNEHTAERYLTGADLDPEGMALVGDTYWIGEEFGPYLIAASKDGKVESFYDLRLAGRVLRSPDHDMLQLPSAPGGVRFDVQRSSGIEGVAASPDGRRLYLLLEGPLWEVATQLLDADEAGRAIVRIIEFDLEERRFTGRSFLYPLEKGDHRMGAFRMLPDGRAVVIERDNGHGDPRVACQNGTNAGKCFKRPAGFKRAFLVRLPDVDNAPVEKIGSIDLLNISDPDGKGGEGTQDGVFTFPFVTIEGITQIDETRLLIVNDNNLPILSARDPSKVDATEMVVIDVPGLAQ